MYATIAVRTRNKIQANIKQYNTIKIELSHSLIENFSNSYFAFRLILGLLFGSNGSGKTRSAKIIMKPSNVTIMYRASKQPVRDISY